MLGAVILATGCGQSGNPVPPPPVATKQTVSAPTGTVQQKTDEGALLYSYHPGTRRDPFTPIIIKEEKKQIAGAKTPLERYPISEFKLAGIVWGALGYRAMLEGPDGKGYFVRQGSIIGPNRGVVKRITEKSLVIEEKFKGPTGEMNRKEIIIEMHSKQEGTP
ncbi:MAG: pilus assembly protein PilP [Nitrospiraceae bacterium]|nr:pilus assembly protein PilP [Nitrospiraceae bacterium]